MLLGKIRQAARTLPLAATLATMATFPAGCGLSAGGDVSPDKALALSASALSGEESFAFAGQVAIVAPSGYRSGLAAYEGEVAGHGQVKMRWSGPHSLSGTGGEERYAADDTEAAAGAWRPLELLGLIGKASADSIRYAAADAGATPAEVRLEIKLEESAAKSRIAELLRAELAALRQSHGSATAERRLASAERKLEQALGELQATTTIYWTADKATWFPRTVAERTEIRYKWNGKLCRELRETSTDFVRGGAGGTIGNDLRR